MGLNLSSKELDAMDGLPHLHRCLYIFGIRRYMDYKTGITGIKRKISYKSLSEEIYEQPVAGVKMSAKSRDQIKRALTVLEKAGLIKRQSVVTKDEKTLILSCLLANRDEHIQNKAAPWPPHYPAQQAAPEIKNSENKEIHYKNSIIQSDDTAKNIESRPEGRHTEFEKAARHPLSVNTILNYTVSPVDNFLTQDENKFLNLFTDLKLNTSASSNLKAITTVKALMHAGVTLKEAEEAIKIKLTAYYDRYGQNAKTPHPAYFKDAIIDYKRDLAAITQQSGDLTHETRRPQQQSLQSTHKADSRRNRYNKILR